MEEIVERTGVFATAVEREDFRRRYEEAHRTSLIPTQDLSLSIRAWLRVHNATHAAALLHGLPDEQGFYYGCDPANGEFVKCKREQVDAI